MDEHELKLILESGKPRSDGRVSVFLPKPKWSNPNFLTDELKRFEQEERALTTNEREPG